LYVGAGHPPAWRGDIAAVEPLLMRSRLTNMSSLPTDIRNLLERTVINARDEAEKAARAALIRLAVHQQQPYATLLAEDRVLRNRLRAEARRLGESKEAQVRDRDEPCAGLVGEVAYAQWHRMLFARLLAENGLLMHPDGVAVTLAECGELAPNESEPDGWMLAARYASAMLPGIFRQDDPTLQVRFDAAGRLALERLLNDLPASVFTADDSLGWSYQFWQTKRKKEVAESGVKIGGADISPVTQLFTEHYMVQFLLHNSLGAWWAARHPGEALPTDLDYLRRKEDGTPAAGSFSGWPERVADLRILDPCCGSGHFLVAAFALMCRFRMMEEGLSEVEAGDVVIRDNLFGLELDPRCTQIAAFALALAAWKSGGYRKLPLPNIACSGLPVGDNPYEFTHLAGGDTDMEAMLRRLHAVFHDAPDLGSLIDPMRIAQEEGIFAIEWDKVGPLLEAALNTRTPEHLNTDPAAAIFGATARGVARAADFLTRHYHLVITNVPYLARGKQDDTLRKHIETFHNDAKADLATAFADRCLRFCVKGGTMALVTPQNWLFLGSYKTFRERLLKSATWNTVVKLGMAAFSDMYWWAFNTGLFVLTNALPKPEQRLMGLDTSSSRVPAEKAELLRCSPIHIVSQSAQLKNPDARLVLEQSLGGELLEVYARSYKGVTSGDDPHFRRNFWEMSRLPEGWKFLQSSVRNTTHFGGCENIQWFAEMVQTIDAVEDNTGYDYGDFEERRKIQNIAGVYIRATDTWGQRGVAVSQMRHLPCSLSLGEPFDTNTAVIMPRDEAHLPAIWAFCSSAEFHDAVRRIDQKLNVTNATLVKVPFDLEHWQQVATEQYPQGLPEPHSDDPTQWLFHGHIARAGQGEVGEWPQARGQAPGSPLQVAVARLLGYRWPQNEDDEFDKVAIADGIACLPSVVGETPAAQRLRDLLATAYGAEWTLATETRLLSDAEFAGQGLDVWLRDGFFAQHCRVFHNRPFLWHIWDGRKDGFSVIVNYHKLDRANLDRLIYTYLGDWINTQRHADSNGVAGANARLVAALALQDKLKAIADGEPPYDIYVRWKPLHKQPIGWEPDINDGVRLNIRPFVTAGILRGKFSINWNKDRGTNPDGSERLNDLHFARAEKETARRLEKAR
jgi:hypothetical protein